jgi:hypothetical protein
LSREVEKRSALCVLKDEERQATLRNALRKARKEVEMLEGLLGGVLDETRAYLGPGEKARDEELGREAKALRAQLSETGSEESKVRIATRGSTFKYELQA